MAEAVRLAILTGDRCPHPRPNDCISGVNIASSGVGTPLGTAGMAESCFATVAVVQTAGTG